MGVETCFVALNTAIENTGKARNPPEISVNPINNSINNVIVPIVLASSEISCNFFSFMFTIRGADSINKSCNISYIIPASTSNKTPDEIIAMGSKYMIPTSLSMGVERLTPPDSLIRSITEIRTMNNINEIVF